MPTLNFKGKTFVQNHHLTVPYHEMVPQPDKSLSYEVRLDDNLIIHGDNLVALKALLPMYAEKVKCIYIDPPYNTGTEHWVYNDNVNSPMIQEWLGGVVDRDDLTRHDKWLCMMMPRLQILRELLRDDGAIFISIDDNEIHHLRDIMDEIFGEKNFIADIIWEKKFSPQNDEKYLTSAHDHILLYAKDKDQWSPNLLPRTDEANERFKNPDNDPRGPWSSGDMTSKTKAKGHSYPITSPSGKVFTPPTGRQWAPSKETFDQLQTEGRIWYGEKGENVPRIKQFLSEVQQGIVPMTIWKHAEVGHNQEAKQELNAIFKDNPIDFDTPKPRRLLKRILQIATGPDDLILDSFAGTGTTAHAVLEINKEEQSHRKFILVEMEYYANDITAERVRRVIRGIPSSRDDSLKNGLNGTFSFFELGQAIDVNSLISGENLPPYMELARYVFYTATGEAFDASNVDESRYYIGSSAHYDVYLLYRPDLSFLKSTALNLEFAESMGPYGNKKRLVFAPMKYLDEHYLEKYHIEYAQLPYEIYRFKG